MNIEIYIARHATPDWTRKDIPYDTPPGPPLTEAGESEAGQLGEFLQPRKVARIYSSPFERTHRTAMLVADVVGVTPIVSEAISEWRDGETNESVGARVLPFWERVCMESAEHGPICLVTHGGPLGLTLHHLGLPRDVHARYREQFDTVAAPPAGVWRATSTLTGDKVADPWQLEFVFKPGVAG